MHRFFVPQLYNEEMTLTGVDARHISKVLRMQPGAQLQLVSDDGVSALHAGVGELGSLIFRLGNGEVFLAFLFRRSKSHRSTS